MSDTPSFNVTRSIFLQEKSRQHSLHVIFDQWNVETCEYCRTEYYLEIPPLGL